MRAYTRLRLREDLEILWLRLLIQRLSKITNYEYQDAQYMASYLPIVLANGELFVISGYTEMVTNFSGLVYL